MENTCCLTHLSPRTLSQKRWISNKIKADYILVSHAHFDHITDTAAIADQTGATVISNYEVISWLGKNGVKNTRPLNPGGTYSSDFGRAKCVNAIARFRV